MKLLELARETATRRNRLHRHSPTSTPYHKDSKLLGIIGELVFAHSFGLSPDLTDRPGGDGHKDFTHRGYTIDVKNITYGKHDYLLCVYGAPVADIVVLCEVDLPTRRAWLTGWAYRDDVLAAPIVTFRKTNWGIHKDKLRPMGELREILETEDAK